MNHLNDSDIQKLDGEGMRRVPLYRLAATFHPKAVKELARRFAARDTAQAELFDRHFRAAALAFMTSCQFRNAPYDPAYAKWDRPGFSDIHEEMRNSLMHLVSGNIPF